MALILNILSSDFSRLPMNFSPFFLPFVSFWYFSRTLKSGYSWLLERA